MTSRNTQARENQIQAKQAYLRQHVAQQKYEDFGQFCQAVAGNIDIEAWSIEYVRELVDKFRKIDDEKEKNKKKTGSFHIYQTGNANEIKNIAHRLKEQQQNQGDKQENCKVQRNQIKNKGVDAGKVKQQKSALQVLDSIFENHPANEYETKKYDKAFFQSCKFWDMPSNEQPAHKQHQKQKGTPSRNKEISVNQANKFASNTFVLQPQNFQKMFQTGLVIPQNKTQQKQQSKEKTPKKRVFEQIPIEDDLPKRNQSQRPQKKGNADNNSKNISSIGRNGQMKNEIKLVSVKDIKTSKNNKIAYDGEILIRQPFKETVACFKSFQRHALSVKDLKVEIVDHQIINRSFFSSDYPMYHLKVHPANIVCKRNFEDFQKLKKNLQNVYPGVRLPYLQKLGWLESQISPQYIAKQKKYLNYFLEDILQHNELRNSRIMEDFLTLKDHKQIKRKFEEYDKIKKISSMEELCLLEGQVKVQITEVNRQYNQFLQSFISKVKHFWTQQERILTQINEMHLKLSSSYKQLKVLIQQITQQTKDFNRRVTINQFQCLEDAFKNLNEYVSENIKVNEKESDFLQNSVLVYLRYQKQNMSMFDNVINVRSSLTRSYLKRKENEKSNDNLEYLSQRLKDYKIDILQESKNITVLRYQCGYINNLLANEGQRYFKFLSEKMEKMISDICYSKLQYLSKSINTYTSLVYS